jgi:NAD(P)-dependent dehydrogenase (short-subunit alcohol dehydrogenase family)
MTVRRLETIADLLMRYPHSARAFRLDLADSSEIPATVLKAQKAFGSIDVLVNNAGYALLAGVEEASVSQYRAIFEANFFGPLEIIRAVLPAMRERRAGHIINVTSAAAYSGGIGLPYYAATKFALTAISESLALEAAHLGIKVSLVEPGAHQTAARQNWQVGEPIDDYGPSIGAMRDLLRAGAGKEIGNTELAAAAIAAVADANEPPLHLPLGQDALDRANAKIALLQRNFEKWNDLVLSTRA